MLDGLPLVLQQLAHLRIRARTSSSRHYSWIACIGWRRS
jgi:hypothetical protein